MSSFEAQMKAFANLMEDKANKVFRKTCLQLSSDIIRSTPVDSGRAKGNWQPDINTFMGGELEVSDKDGSMAIAKVGRTTSQLKIGSTFTLVNNLPYIDALEYGHSKQSPQGMVRINLLRFNNILQLANQEIK